MPCPLRPFRHWVPVGGNFNYCGFFNPPPPTTTAMPVNWRYASRKYENGGYLMTFPTNPIYADLIGIKEAAFPEDKNDFSKLSIYFIIIYCELNFFLRFFIILKIHSKANSN